MVDIFEKNILYKVDTKSQKKSYLEKLKNMYKDKIFKKDLKDKKNIASMK